MIGEEETKQAGDFRRFLKSQRGRGVLEDTGGYVYHFKRVIHKRNHFGKVCRCTVWRCKHYKRLNCPCNVHTYGQTIIGSNKSHNHTATQDGSRIELNQLIVSQATGTDKSANTISAELLHKYRMRLRTPQLESVKRSVRRARQHYRKRLHSNHTPPTTQKAPKLKQCKKSQPSLPETKAVPVTEEASKPTRTPTIEDFPILKDIDTLKEVLELLHEMSDENTSTGDLSSFDLPTSSTPFSTSQDAAPPFDISAVSTPLSQPSYSGHSPLPLGNDGTQISFELPPKSHKYPKIDIPLPTSFVPNRTIDDVRPSIIIPDLTPSLPSKNEFKILSDQVALQNILNLLKLTNSVPNSISAGPTDVIRHLPTHECSSSKCKCNTTPDTPPPYNCAVNQCDPPIKRRRRRGPNKTDKEKSTEPPKKRGRSKKPFKYIPPNMSDPCPNATIPQLLPHSTVPVTSGQDPGTPCISLIPISQNTSNLENSKLLKAVPIGNGLYRLEEPDQGVAQVMSRESVYQAAAPSGATEVTASVYTPSTNSVNFDHVGVLPQISPKPTAIEQPSMFSPQRGDNLFSTTSNLFSPPPSSSVFEPSIFSLLQKAQLELQGQHSAVSPVPSTASILSSLAALVSHSNQTNQTKATRSNQINLLTTPHSNQTAKFNSTPVQSVPSNLAPLPAHLRSINTSTHSQPRSINTSTQPRHVKPMTVEQQTESLMKLLKNAAGNVNLLPKSKPPLVDYSKPINLAAPAIPAKSKRRNNSRGLEMSLDSFDLTANDNLMSTTNAQTTNPPTMTITDKTAEVLQLNQIIGAPKRLLRSANLEKSLIAAFKNA